MFINQILTKLKSLVYSKSETDSLLNGKASSSHTHTKSEITDFPTIPSKTSQLTNDSGFLTAHQSLSDYSTKANTVKSLSISGKTITVTPGSGNAYTLTTQDTTYSFSDKNVTLAWGTKSTIATVGGTDIHVTMPANPNTNTWTAMVGATSSANGSVGYVNAIPPKDGYNTKYLRADGTWQVPPDHTYTVNNATLTIQKNGSNVATFTANASSNVTANITVPTVNNATLTIQKNGTNVATFTSNASSNVTANISVPTNTNQLTNGSGFITSSSLMYLNDDRANNAYRIVFGTFNNKNNVSTGRHKLTFPYVFSATPRVVITLQNPDGLYNCQVSNITKTSFISEIWDGSGNRTSNGVAIDYMAIGKC